MHPVTAISVLAFALSVLTGPRGASALPTGNHLPPYIRLMPRPIKFNRR